MPIGQGEKAELPGGEQETELQQSRGAVGLKQITDPGSQPGGW